jgi:hypothetical protein
MKIDHHFLEVVLMAVALPCFDAVTGAQQISQQDLPTLSHHYMRLCIQK